MPINAVALPFREQAEFLRRKINIKTDSWVDIYNTEHDWAFVVAGANRDALVADFRKSVEAVVNDGITLESFRKQFDDIVAKNGWSYNGGRNWRSRVIYETNLNSSYQAGRYEQLMAVREQRPYWQYLHSDAVENPRLLHESWDGLILRWDDPWWQTHFPVNGWGCQCRVIALSDADLKRMGRTVDTAPAIKYIEREIGQRSPGGPFVVRVPEGIDPSFEHIPGRGRLSGATPPPTTPMPPPPSPIPPPAPPTPVPAPKLLPSNTSAADASRGFLELFDAVNAPTIFTDVAENPVVIGARMLRNLDAVHTSYLPAIAQTIQNPTEIWTRTVYDAATKRAVIRRTYIANYAVAGGETLVAVDIGADGWAIAIDDAANVYRQGLMAYSTYELIK
jgi:hypothetical protein